MKKETTTPKVIKGYKGYDKNLQCRGKQYEIGKEYTEPSAVACESGIHFCENPFDVWNYYPLQDGNRFTEVEGSGKLSTHGDDSKVAASNVKIGVELSLKGMIEAGIKFIFEKTKSSKETTATTGDYANAATTGYSANAATTGYRANAATTGNRANAATTGYRANAATTGNMANAATTGDYANAATTGYSANAATTGYRANAATTGNRANAATTGDYANAATTGYRANAATTGNNCIAAALGQNSKAKGALGNWLVVGEWEQDKDYNWLLIGVATAKVDGKKIKPDKWYTAKNGKLVISE